MTWKTSSTGSCPCLPKRSPGPRQVAKSPGGRKRGLTRIAKSYNLYRRCRGCSRKPRPSEPDGKPVVITGGRKWFLWSQGTTNGISRVRSLSVTWRRSDSRGGRQGRKKSPGAWWPLARGGQDPQPSWPSVFLGSVPDTKAKTAAAENPGISDPWPVPRAVLQRGIGDFRVDTMNVKIPAGGTPPIRWR